ncbi:MAG: hypothetical protein Ta2F_18370 [Termitinemataceae bacterium]|nr:MAG: hypothetical protein Ta2F_18370 [Termitinemataceae bacterium]
MLEELISLDKTTRLVYIASGMYFYISEKHHVQNCSLKSIALIACIIDMLLKTGEATSIRVFSASTIKRFLRIVLCSEMYMQKIKGVADFKVDLDALIKAMEKTGLIIKNKTHYSFLDRSFLDRSIINEKEALPLIAFDSAYSFFPMPELKFADVIELAKFCEIKMSEGGKLYFELTRESVNKVLNTGMLSSDILEIITALSLGRLNNNVKTTLEDWQRRYTEVSVFEGITVVLSKEMLFLSQTESFKELILSNPAECIFILNIKDKQKLFDILKQSGVQSIAEPKENSTSPKKKNVEKNKKKQDNVYFKMFDKASLVTPEAKIEAKKSEANKTALAKQSAESYKNIFRKKLSTLQLKAADKEELSDRIERSLIFSESQLVNSSLRYEKRQANSMDYIGKIAISKQALMASEILELEFSNENGKRISYTGYPQSISKTQNDSILSLKLIDADDIITISIGKIQSIRRIKNSIFS